MNGFGQLISKANGPKEQEADPPKFSNRPCDPQSGELIAPSQLEDHCRTHLVRPPCCLCPIATGKGYSSSRISIVQASQPDSDGSTSILNGEYVASCASGRCGYFGTFNDSAYKSLTHLTNSQLLLTAVCLERYYSLDGIRVRAYPLRGGWA